MQLHKRNQIFSAFILSLATLACQAAGLLLTPTPILPTATLFVAPTVISSSTSTPTITLLPTLTPTLQPVSERVVILSIDGLRPDAIQLAPMPNLLALMQTGAYTLNAQTIFPSATLPAHASMITGLCPSRHGVTWNDYMPENGFAQGTDLFDLAHAAGMKTVMYVGKEKLRQLTEPASTDIFVYINDRDLVIIDQLLANFPVDFQLMFIHFPAADWMGHEYGWLSPEQLSVLFRADEALNNLLVALDSYGLRDGSLLIITADHGGHNTTHGSSRPEDMTIPWIISGPGVVPRQLTTPVQTMDTAATAAYALGLPVPEEWDGIPVTEAFGLPVETDAAIACP